MQKLYFSWKQKHDTLSQQHTAELCSDKNSIVLKIRIIITWIHERRLRFCIQNISVKLNSVITYSNQWKLGNKMSNLFYFGNHQSEFARNFFCVWIIFIRTSAYILVLKYENRADGSLLFSVCFNKTFSFHSGILEKKSFGRKRFWFTKTGNDGVVWLAHRKSQTQSTRTHKSEFRE